MGQSKWSYIDTDAAPSSYVNTNSSNLATAATSQQIADLEAQLSDEDAGVVARVIHLSGNYVKVKWFKNGKTIGMYKARGHTLAKATSALEYYKENNLGLSGVDTLLLETDDSTVAVEGTAQLTVTATLDDEEEVDVTTKAYFSSDPAGKVSIDSAGELTALAGGTQAEGTLTSDATAPTANDTVTLDDVTYIFETALTEAKAVGTLTSTGVNVSNNDTVTIGANTYTFKTTIDNSVANQVLIGASAAASLDNLKSAVNRTDAAGTTYSTATVVHPTVTATTNTDTTQVVQAKTIGVAGNAIVSTEAAATLSWGAATLASGADSVENEVLIGASAAVSLDNLKSAVNGTAGAGTTYSTATVAHPTVEATTNTDTTQLFVARVGGTQGDTIATTEAGTHTSFGAETLEGGEAVAVTVTATYGGESDDVEVTVG